MKVQQRLLGNYSHLQIDMCGIIDRCSPSRCEHGGRCSQSWTVFHCNCSDSGYSGATCHSPVYEQSCEAYKHNGNTSGHFYIDVDGSGPIKPQLVYCNMTVTHTTHTHTHTHTHTTDTHPPHIITQSFMIKIYIIENTWMVIQHNNSELTRVRPSPEVNQHSVHFDYSTEEEQLLAAISQSEYCEQDLSYHCRKSRLLNTPGLSVQLVARGSRSRSCPVLLGGGSAGQPSSVCAGCRETVWTLSTTATVTLTAPSGLRTRGCSPIRRASLSGDVRRPGSEAVYRNFWNAAFFDKETSYLHFPTFHGELSADISFLFKTTASSGVFLENLGIKDFIRIELSSSTRVVFSLDVGNGPLEVHVESMVPLNDNRWHRVRAERNVKEASLRLDGLPVATQEAPADGHLHLQLNSQLFIAERRPLDLEERAEITPGVQPGCPGHCSSYGSLCQNQGRCVERASGFHCDCGLSAHTGAFCHTELSASFQSGTSLRYTFKEPYELSRNRSALPSSIYSDLTLRGENDQSEPALLLYVSSYYAQYLALLINKHDNLEVRYKLDSSRDAEVLKSKVESLADGDLHTINQNPREDFNLTSDGEFNGIKSLVLGRVQGSGSRSVQVGVSGFAGCLSVVRFNSISPLKAALLHPDSSPVTISGPLLQSSCGSSAAANPYAAENTHHLSGVIAVVIFVIVTVLAITARFLYRRKETYRNQEVKGVKQEDSQDFHFNNQTDPQNVSSENPKEYFI
ncbi:hypothetical protein F7725_011077 [Dissostichus mawsoni]|uniref:Contactin associated protein like 3 n=1 Tax=Dissostichus mawsoni TaxID=36200 RepID=A0A7J5Z879_DISMA|nr:hypothetical protein F7725_011077 [Dissostichus mawsoni]